jgi:hypothetical protein
MPRLPLIYYNTSIFLHECERLGNRFFTIDVVYTKDTCGFHLGWGASHDCVMLLCKERGSLWPFRLQYMTRIMKEHRLGRIDCEKYYEIE